MWHWLDWVIETFNRNLQFIVDQLAGDLLPSPTVEQRIATGFCRNHMINFEGGAIPAEYHNEYVVDRMDTIANVFMGSTLGLLALSRPQVRSLQATRLLPALRPLQQRPGAGVGRPRR